MNILENERAIELIEKVVNDPFLLMFLVSMGVVSLALFVVYHAVKSRKE